MKKKTQIWLITAACLMIIGLIIFAAAMSVNGWDFTTLTTQNYVTNTYEFKEDFKNISFDTDTADITFKISDEKQTKVVCFEDESLCHIVAVGEDTLKISLIDERKWYEHIGINFESPKITVYLPKSEYAFLLIKESTGDIEIPKDFKFASIDISVSTGDIKNFASASDFIEIKSNTGDILTENIKAKTIDLSVSTGEITAENISCSNDLKISVNTGKASLKNASCLNLVSSGDTGDLSLQNVIAKEKFSLERDTGDIGFDGCDAGELLIKTDTGDVKGTLLSDKVFITESDTGSIDVPKTVSGGRCEVTTNTGDIRLTIK